MGDGHLIIKSLYDLYIATLIRADLVIPAPAPWAGINSSRNPEETLVASGAAEGG